MFYRITKIRPGAAARAVFVFALGGALLAACSSEPEEQPPHAALLDSLRALKDNDLRTFVTGSMGNRQYQELGAKWDEARKQELSDQDRAQFNLMLGMVTAPGAEDNLMALIEPQLAQWRPQMKEMIFGLQAFATLQLQNMSELDAEQKQMLTQGLKSLTEWVKSNDLTSAASARKAIAIGIKTVSDLGFKSLDDVNALDYDGLLNKGGAVLGGVKQMLAVYGIGIDKMIDSVQAETIDQQGDRAEVRVSFDFFGARQQADAKFVRVDGQWLSEDAVTQARDAMSSQLAAIPPMDSADSPPTSTDSPEPGAPPPAGAAIEQTPPDAEEPVPEPTPPAQQQAAPSAAEPPPPVATNDPDEVYLAYREALASAERFEDIEKFWAPWVSATAADQEAAVKQRKLEQLRALATDAEVLSTRAEPNSAELTVSGTRNGDESIEGTIGLVRAGDEWRIDSVSWSSPPMVAADDAADVAPAPVVEESPDRELGRETSAPDPAPSAANRKSDAPLSQARVAPQADTPVSVATGSAAMDKDTLQASFDGNPFLSHYGMRFEVLQLSQGFATVELARGPTGLVDRLKQGVDLTALDPQSLSVGRERQALHALRKLSDTLVDNGSIAALLIVPPKDMAATNDNEVARGTQEQTDTEQVAAAVPAEEAAKEQARKQRQAMIRAIQKRLAELDYDPGPADGKAGRWTRAAIREYQRAVDLPEDGQPSQTLRAHLYSDRAVARAAPQPTTAPEPEPQVVEAQEAPEKKTLKDRIGGFFKKILKNEGGSDTAIPESETAD